MNFFSKPALNILILCLSSAGVLLPLLKYSSTQKGKSCYFIKKTPTDITEENMREVLIIGEFSSKSVDELAVLTEEIFFPLLSNPLNHQGWPDVVSKDVTTHIEAFKNTVYQVGWWFYIISSSIPIILVSFDSVKTNAFWLLMQTESE